MGTVHEKTILKNTDSHPADSLDAKVVFRLAGNRIFRIDPLPRGKMADVPLQKSKNGLTSADVLNYLREDAGRRAEC
jgi:hypothetical protein